MTKRLFRCERCDLESEVMPTYCSATIDLVCQGRDPVEGCGEVLTPEERHYYGDCCEECEGEWCQRIEVWRHGGKDEELDRKYGIEERTLQ